MSEFREYLDHSERFINAAEATTSEDEENALLCASIMFSWIAIESFVNNVSDDFNQVPSDMFPMHERAFLLEKKLRFEDSGSELGKFIIDRNQNEFRRLEEKIFFLIAKFSQAKNLRGDSLWQTFEKFKDKRNKITHPRRNDEVTLDINETKDFFNVAREIIDLISKNVWKKSIDF